MKKTFLISLMLVSLSLGCRFNRQPTEIPLVVDQPTVTSLSHVQKTADITTTAIEDGGTRDTTTTAHKKGTPTGNDITASIIENKRTRDFRRLFRPEKQIEDMETRQVCLVQAAGHATAGREFFVGNGLSVEKVIFEVTGKTYDGQIKVISRDSIVQTPLTTYDPGRQKTMQVNPGDLVFIYGRD